MEPRNTALGLDLDDANAVCLCTCLICSIEMARTGPARRTEAPVGASKVQPASATTSGAFTSPPSPSSSSWLGALPSPERFSKCELCRGASSNSLTRQTSENAQW